MVTGRSLNKRFNKQEHGCDHAFQLLVHYFTVLSEKKRETAKFCVVWIVENQNHMTMDNF